jgi:hypothetical protein
MTRTEAPREQREIADALQRRLIPARDDLVAGLDALAARRLVAVGQLGAAAHTRGVIAIDLAAIVRSSFGERSQPGERLSRRVQSAHARL